MAKITGAGTIEKLGKNSYRVRFNLGRDPLTGKYRYSPWRHVTGNKAQAEKVKAEYRNELENGIKADADRMLFGVYSQQWHENRKLSGNFADSTMDKDSYALKNLSRHLEAVLLKDIDATTVKALYLAFSKDGMGQGAIQTAARILNQVMRSAVVDDVLLRNPCDKVPKPKAPAKRRCNALTREGVTRLMSALKQAESEAGDPMQPERHTTVSRLARITATRLALATGMRRGEILGLTWEGAALDTETIHVWQSLTKDKKLKAPKTKNSIRDITIDKVTVETLRRWKRVQAEYLLSLGISQDASTPVITDELGGFSDGHNFGRWWRGFIRLHGFKGLRFHDLRHYGFSWVMGHGRPFRLQSIA
jgi:integrase